MDAERRRRALAELHGHAGRQHGVVLSRQIRRSGLSSEVIHRLVKDGWLIAVRTGAYTVGGPATDWQRVVAAGLLAGPDVVVSHATAATVHRFPALVPSPSIELTAAGGRHPELAGVTVHRVRDLPVDDFTGYRGLTVTRPARTLVDLGGRLVPRLLARVVDEGLVAGLWTEAELRASASRAGGRTRPWLDRVLEGSGPGGEGRAESALEQRAQRALSCLGPFETQWQV
ncbi:MAG TPA: type IV toxin-antitoxin system AbiEi family antitoxin domain-containing protein, partial [Acidimicrobiales bacterium]|nr:type IV toxin-antitoxin system AbiEi family antitoxin domain-containing protein [Acidimicrobiales bacterium]